MAKGSGREEAEEDEAAEEEVDDGDAEEEEEPKSMSKRCCCGVSWSQHPAKSGSGALVAEIAIGPVMVADAVAVALQETGQVQEAWRKEERCWCRKEGRRLEWWTGAETEAAAAGGETEGSGEEETKLGGEPNKV